MSTYTTITITGPNERLAAFDLEDEDTLPLFNFTDLLPWELNTTETTFSYLDGRKEVPLTEHFIQLSGNTKWSPEGVAEWAQEFTGKHPGLTVTAREEWDNRDADEPGVEHSVYRAGLWIKDESRINGEVPLELHLLVKRAEEAITLWDAEYKMATLAGLQMRDLLRSFINNTTL